MGRAPNQRNRDQGGNRDRAIPAPRPVEYFVEGHLSPTLLEEAERLAERIGDDVRSSQLRRFYTDVTTFERRLDTDRDLPDAAVRAHMGLLKAKAVYAHARPSQPITRDLLQFFVDHAAAATTRADYKAFRQVFETVIAFHKFHEKQQGGRN